RLKNVAQVHVPPEVALAREGEDGVRPRLEEAVDRPREVHAEEGEARVWDGVEQAADQIAPAHRVVLAAEWDDLHLRRPRQAIGVQARAENRVVEPGRRARNPPSKQDRSARNLDPP